MTNTIETFLAGFADGGREKSDGWIVSGVPSSVSVKLPAVSPPTGLPAPSVTVT